jgi:LmbE family N-acetylglucosaminyl deacetylase
VNSSTRERTIAGEGTAEAVWSACGDFDALPVLDLAACTRAVVIAPHPDDETLGAGGTIAMLLDKGAETVVVFASNGEASHPVSTAISPRELSARRTAESAAALDALTPAVDARIAVVRWQLPDGGLAGREEAMAERLGELLQPGDWCLATWDRDGHPDHEAVGRAARDGSASAGARLLSYPVWAWHWAAPPGLPWSRASRLVLSQSARTRKRQAVACYKSQIEPLGPGPGDAAIVAPTDLAHFARPFEVVFT